jgi:hypothetical protein
MSQHELPTRQESPREARFEMIHGACGGRADLTILQDLNNVFCLMHCYDCGYVETWSPDPGAADQAKFLM